MSGRQLGRQRGSIARRRQEASRRYREINRRGRGRADILNVSPPVSPPVRRRRLNQIQSSSEEEHNVGPVEVILQRPTQNEPQDDQPQVHNNTHVRTVRRRIESSSSESPPTQSRTINDNPQPGTSREAERINRYRSQLNNERLNEIRQEDRIRHQIVRQNLSEDQRETIRENDRIWHQNELQNLPEERREEIREANRSQHQNRRQNLPEGVQEAIQEYDRAQRQIARPNIPDDRRQAIRSADNARHRANYRRNIVAAARPLQQLYQDFLPEAYNVNEPIRYREHVVNEHSCGPFRNIMCRYCDAYHFEAERGAGGKFKSCCRHGRLQLPTPARAYPQFLKDALTNPDNPDYRELRRYIRNYNSALSFVSLGANIVRPAGRGEYVFQINGTVHHFMPPLLANENQAPRYEQLYFLDSTTQAVDARMEHPANADLDKPFLRRIQKYIETYNHYAILFRSTIELLREAREDQGINLEEVGLIFNRDYQQPGIHPGRLNAPAAANEVAAVFAMNNEGIPAFQRDFAVYAKEPANQENLNRQYQLHPQSPHLDPMAYVLLHIHGETGWRINYECQPYGDNQPLNRRVTLLQFKAALLQERPGPWRPILHAGALSQQWAVDSYLQVESNNLGFIRLNQNALAADAYIGLNQYIERQAEQQGREAAPAIILPSTFTGSARNLRQLCLDAMALFGRFGQPDIFVTFTCNPKWKEIVDSLLPGERAHDRPDIVARVFKIKLNELLDDICKKGIFGPVVGYVYTIEFQKRGLPHAHILITLQNGFKPNDAASVDRIVCAEIPDRNANPVLFDIVTKCMIHGPCGPNLCHDERGRCKKHFPKPIYEETRVILNDYPQYRRRNLPPVEVNGRQINNRFVVPYNPFLLKKYNAHINVEVCTSIQGAIKYLYKYIFKGFDVASLTLTRDNRVIRDEVQNFISGRYVSAPEAIWRLFEFKLHDRSHFVCRLPVHLERQNEIYFEDGFNQAPEQEDRMLRSMLNAFFEMNIDPQSPSRQLLYTEIPLHYVYESRGRRWNIRQQRGNVVARMRDVNPQQRELFSLRVLLLHVRGPTDFVNLRTINGVQFNTFHEAAQALHLMRDDNMFFNTFENSITVGMPPSLRVLFANMLLNDIISTGLIFWDRFKYAMIVDFRRMVAYRDASDEMLYNLALHHLNTLFERRGVTCQRYGLPMPQGVCPAIDLDPPPAPIHQIGDAAPVNNIQLNEAQQRGFNRIMEAVQNQVLGQPVPNKCFLIIGPGGSGKTTLYKQILQTCRERGIVARAYATTGIAATLMEGGLTAHRGFRIPIALPNPDLRSSLERNMNLPEHAQLRDAQVILIDEITMMLKDGLRVINQTLQFIMGNYENFGGKIIVVGGDFRQLLPVVPRATVPQIIAESVISSPLWRSFSVISLTRNMRAQGNREHNEWLLKLGTGLLPPIEGLDPNMIEIPQDMLLNVPGDDVAVEPGIMPPALKAMIDNVFGLNIDQLEPNQLASRAILSSTIRETMMVNNFVVNTIPGEVHRYLSADSAISDDPNVAANYPVEYLNNLQPSGIPPHELNLKLGMVIMLIRNLNPELGLSNGTRLIVENMQPHLIVSKIISESHYGAIHHIPRMDIVDSDGTLPFILQRQQFPIIPAFAMTINKSQGQTLDRVGLYLNDVVFAHGQLYVAMSRCRNRENIKVYVKNQGTRQGNLLGDHRIFTRNVVYREVFRHGELQELNEDDNELRPFLPAALLQINMNDINDINADEAIIQVNMDEINIDEAIRQQAEILSQLNIENIIRNVSEQHEFMNLPIDYNNEPEDSDEDSQFVNI